MKDWKQIVWLASYPKSGNTWIRCLLDAYFLGEVDINDLVVSVSDDNALRASIGDGRQILDQPMEIQMLARPMSLLRLVSAWEKDAIPGIPLFCKTHCANLIVNGQAQLPETLTRKIVYLARDPRDVLPSFASHMGLDLDKAVESITDQHKALYGAEKLKLPEVISSWGKHVSSYLYCDNMPVLFMKYEDLKADPDTQFARFLEWCEVDVDMGKVRKAIEITELSKLKKQEDEKGFRESSEFTEGFFGRKHKKPEYRHLRKVETKFAKMMRQLGYTSRKAA